MTHFGKILIVLIFILLAGIGILFYQLISVTGESIDPYLSHITTKDGDFVYHEDTQYYSISALYPVALPAVILNDIENYLRSEIDEFKASGKFDSLTPNDLEVLGLNDGRKYVLGIEYSKIESEKISSHILRGDMFTGGAHGNPLLKVLNYEKPFSNVSINDILVDESSLNEVSSLVLSDIKRQFDLGDEEAVIFYDGLLSSYDNFKNFYFTDSAIHFIFPPYQVLPYVYGFIDVALSFDDMYLYIKPQYMPGSFTPPDDGSTELIEN